MPWVEDGSADNIVHSGVLPPDFWNVWMEWIAAGVKTIGDLFAELGKIAWTQPEEWLKRIPMYSPFTLELYTDWDDYIAHIEEHVRKFYAFRWP